MTAAEIMMAITENRSKYKAFGIRGDDRIFSVGDELPCSQNMIDDLYDYETGEYPLLDGTCATGFGFLWFDGEEEDVETVQKALDINKGNYTCKNRYLVGGYGCEDGDDNAELVIKGAEVICVI